MDLNREFKLRVGGTVDFAHFAGANGPADLVKPTGHSRDQSHGRKEYDPPVAKTQVAKKTFGKRKILIIDDEESIRYVIRDALAELPYEVREASDGEIGWEMARVFLPDLIVLDLTMPNLDGFGFIRECMGHLATRNIPIIIHTSQDLDPEELSYLQQVTVGFVKKDKESSEKIKGVVKTYLGEP